MKKKIIFLTMMLLTLFGSVKWNVLNAQDDLGLGGKTFRIKVLQCDSYNTTEGKYVTIIDTQDGIISFSTMSDNDHQKFKFTHKEGNQYYIESLSGYSLVCSMNNVVAQKAQGTPITVQKTTWGINSYYTLTSTLNSKSFDISQLGIAYILTYYGNFVAWALEEVVACTTPDAPVLAATAINHNSVTLEWDAIQDATKYNVYDNNGGLIAENIQGTSYTVTNLTPETNYSYTVTAVNGSCESDNSNSVSVTTTKAPKTQKVAFKLMDSGNNGWENAILYVYLNGSGYSTAAYTLANGSEIIYYLDIDEGANVELMFRDGSSNVGQCSYEVYYHEDNEIIVTSGASGRVNGNNAYYFTVRGPVVKSNIDEIAFGSVRLGNVWSEKTTPSFQVNLTAEYTEIESITIDNEFFVSDTDLSGAAGQAEFSFNLSYNINASAGEKSGKIIVTYMNHEDVATKEIDLSASAYTPVTGDIVENPYQVAFANDETYTTNVTAANLHDDYIFPNEYNEGTTPDAIFEFTLDKTSLVTVNVSTNNHWLAVYNETFNGQGGPKADNQIDTWLNNTVMEAGTYYVLVATTEDYTINITRQDIPLPQITYYSPLDGEVVYENNPMLSYHIEYADSYQLFLGTSEDNLQVVKESTDFNDMSHQTEGLQLGTKYYWKIKATSTVGTNDTTRVRSFVTPLDKPATINASDTELYPGESVTLTWDAVDGVLGYNVYADGVLVGEKIDGTTLTLQYEELNRTSYFPNYEFAVAAVYELGESARTMTYVQLQGQFDLTINVICNGEAVEGATVVLSGGVDELGHGIAERTFTTNANGQINEKVLSLLSTDPYASYTVTVSKAMYETTETVIQYYETYFNTELTKDIAIEMKGLENVVATPNPIYYGSATTVTWNAINEADGYNVYVNGAKHNINAITTAQYVISDLPYNVEDGNRIEVKAVYGNVESAATPIYVKVVGTFTAQFNVKDNDDNPIADAEIVITNENSFNDELGNTIPQFEINTDANGQATIALPLLPGHNYYEYYRADISKGAYTPTSDMMAASNYERIYANGQVVEREITMSLPAPTMATIEAKNYFVGDAVVLTWQAPDPLASSFLGYNIYRIPLLEGEPVQLNDVPETGLTFTITDLDYGTHYIGVSAVYDEGESSTTSTTVKVTDYGRLIGTVKDTEGNFVSGAEIVVTGLDEFGTEQTYNNIQTDNNGEFVIDTIFLSGNEGYTVNATKFGYYDYTSSGASNAYVTYNDGAASEVEVVMKSYPVVELNVQSSDEVDSAYVSWDSPLGAQNYTLYRTDLTSNETTEVATNLTSTNYADKNWASLANGEYQYGVSAYMEEYRQCLFEDFDDGEMPQGWSVYHSGTITRGDWKISNSHNGSSSYGYQGYAAQSPNPMSTIYNSSKFFMVTSLVDLTDAVTPKMSFAYYTPTGNLLRVLVLTESQGQQNATNGTPVWEINETETGGWVFQPEVDLSAYQGQKVYIVFENNLSTTGISSVDHITITSGPKYYTSQISWAAPLVKGTIIYTGTGNWDDDENWSTGVKPLATDNVTIKGQVTVTGTVNVNSITIARNQGMMGGMGEYENYSLTVESGATLNVTEGIVNNSYSNGLVINDGAQVFQNYADVDATFVMNINNPTTSWSDNPTEGWQIIAAPLKNASTYSFKPGEDDYDLYKYDGTKELQWVNHKYHTQGGYEFLYNFDDKTMPAEFTLIDADNDNDVYTKWRTETYDNSSYLHNLGMNSSLIGSTGCAYSEAYAGNDSYMVLPKSKIVQGSKLTFKAASRFSKTYAENYLYNADCESVEILVSENGNTLTTDFVRIGIFEVTNGGNNSSTLNWADFEVDLSAYADKEIYIALRHTNAASYANMLMIDNLRLVGDAFEVFEESFVQGRGYLASYETQTTATFTGTLNHETEFRFKDVTSYNAAQDTASILSNFYLLGNPFTFNMNWANVVVSGVYNGYATVNENGTYDYHTSGTINVGDGFFVQTTANNPSVVYTQNRSRTQQENVNLMVTAKNGSDNVIINFGGEANEGFMKLENHNDKVAEIYVVGADGRYGIMNYDKDVETVEVFFDAKHLGSYTISALTEGKFEQVVLVDRSTGIETNLLVEDYTFTAKAEEDEGRFLVKFVNSQQVVDDDDFVYQSGGELIVSTQGTIQIVDVLGRVVYQKEHSNDINRIDVENLGNATYVVRCVNGNKVKTQKIVIL